MRKIPYRVSDKIGQRFGMLTVNKFSQILNDRTYWQCICDCGTIKEVNGSDLMGGTISCGCYRTANMRAGLRTTHGASRRNQWTRLYKIWRGMKARCFYKESNRWRWYGGKGIVVCAEWLDFAVFECWAHSSGYQDTLTIDRINNNGNYEPNNCQWITKSANSKKRWH